MNKKSKQCKTRHIGETCMQNCGMACTITDYIDHNNITVQFTDGTTVKHKSYYYFQHGGIQNPNIPKQNNRKTSRIGETHMQNCGMECTIIKYVSGRDITVKFTDGVILKHRHYWDFIRGDIRNPNIPKRNNLKTSRIGETCMQNCGMECTIIKYVDAGDITVKFTDGTIIKHRQYSGFKRGKIQNPNISENIIRVGETCMQNCGMECTIIKYVNVRDITVQFADGIIVKHRGYAAFKQGQIQNPNLPIKKIGRQKTYRIGETRMQNCGIGCTIIEYMRGNDITIKFTDKTILKHRIYDEFLRGAIRHPALKLYRYNRPCPVHQTKTAKYYNATCKICGYNYILTPMQMIEHVNKFHPETLADYKGDER